MDEQVRLALLPRPRPEAPNPYRDFAAQLARIACPTLVRAGETSSIQSAEDHADHARHDSRRARRGDRRVGAQPARRATGRDGRRRSPGSSSADAEAVAASVGAVPLGTPAHRALPSAAWTECQPSVTPSRQPPPSRPSSARTRDDRSPPRPPVSVARPLLLGGMPTEPTQDGPTFRRRTVVVGVAPVLVLADRLSRTRAPATRGSAGSTTSTTSRSIRSSATVSRSAGSGRRSSRATRALDAARVHVAHDRRHARSGLSATGAARVVNVVPARPRTRCLLLLLLVRTTGALAPSVAVAALFALHPLRVESVAWIGGAEGRPLGALRPSSRCTPGWLRPRRRATARTRRVVGATILALLSKPMLVTLPLLLVCFDVAASPARDVRADGSRLTTQRPRRREAPALRARASRRAAITPSSLRARRARSCALDGHPLSARIAHAIVSYVWYVWKTVVADAARRSSIRYPTWSTWQIRAARCSVIGAARSASSTRRRAPWIALGLAGSSLGLAPVIGLFQAGATRHG